MITNKIQNANCNAMENNSSIITIDSNANERETVRIMLKIKKRRYFQKIELINSRIKDLVATREFIVDRSIEIDQNLESIDFIERTSHVIHRR